MAERIIFPEWRKQNEPTKYPFSERASLTSDDGRIFVEGTFLDAALYPIGSNNQVYLAAVEIDHQHVKLVLGDPVTPELATGTIPLVGTASEVIFEDAYGRPAGVIVSEATRLGIFQSWGVGRHEFRPEASEFAATVVFPTPEVGVRGFRLEDGSLFVGDVWLVGADGVVFRTTETTIPGRCGQAAQTVQAIRVDIVGDPLFRRRLCEPNELFDTPRFVKTVRFVGPNRTFECAPDIFGNLIFTSGHQLASDTVLRVVNRPDGIRIEAVGEQPSENRREAL